VKRKKAQKHYRKKEARWENYSPKQKWMVYKKRKKEGKIDVQILTKLFWEKTHKMKKHREKLKKNSTKDSTTTNDDTGRSLGKLKKNISYISLQYVYKIYIHMGISYIY